MSDAEKVNWIYSISSAELPTQTCDLHTMTKIAFLEFMANNPDVCVHSIGFSSEINVPKTDMLGNAKTGDDVLKFMAEYGAGQYHYADSAQVLANEIYSICFMTNTEMSDTLSDYVQVSDDPEINELRVVQTDGEGSDVVLYENGTLTEAGAEILDTVSLDPATGKIRVKFKPNHAVNPAYLYTASFNVQVTPAAYAAYAEDGYTDVGDTGTDYGTNATSAGKEGFYSNAEGKVTWTAGGQSDEESFDKPVIQIREYDLRILKTDTAGEPLKEAEFTLTCTSVLDSEPVTATTGDDGVALFAKLQAGRYTLTETKAPDGYMLAPHSWTVEVTGSGIRMRPDGTAGAWTPTVNGSQYTYTIVNQAKLTVPMTGGNGSGNSVLAGAILTALGMLLMMRGIRRKRGATHN